MIHPADSIALFYLHYFLLFSILPLNLPFVFISFFYSNNIQRFNMKDELAYNKVLDYFLWFNFSWLMLSILSGLYIIPAAIFFLIPLYFYWSAKRSIFKQSINFILPHIYLLNVLLLLWGGYENPGFIGPRNGTYYAYHDLEKTKLRLIEEYDYGIRNGNYLEFHENGQLKMKLNLVDNKIEGEVQEFYENGNKQYVYEVFDSELDGSFVAYHLNQKIARQQTYVSGKIEGVQRNFYKNGKLESECSYKDGILRGKSEFFHENGTTKMRCYYDDRPLEAVEYYENGQLKSSGKSMGVLKTGVWESYYPNGQLMEVGSYQINDEQQQYFKNGLWRSYHENGKLYRIGHFKNGNRTGQWYSYKENGAQSITRNYGL